MEQSLKPCPVCKTTDHPKSTNKGHLCKPCANDRSLKWAKQNKDRFVSNQRKYRYGITSLEYDQKLEQQKGNCAICELPETSLDKSGAIRQLAIDHNHQTGKVRGLLCLRCNTSLGLLNENKEVLKAMLNYMETHDEP